MASRNLTEEEGIFDYLRAQHGSIDKAWAGIGAEANLISGRYGDGDFQGAVAGIQDEDSLREALAGPHREGIIAVLIGLKGEAPPDTGAGPNIHDNVRDRTETVGQDETITIHAEKNQDIEVENDEPHAVSVGAAQEITVGGRSAYQHNQTDLEFVRQVHGGGANPGVWGDPHVDEGPSTLLGEPDALRAWDGDYGFDGVGVVAHDIGGASGHGGQAAHGHAIVGDWNGDGPDTVGLGDFDGDGDVDGADFL